MKTNKRIITLSTMLLIALFALPFDIVAQKGGGPPPWAPAHGYRAKTRHVYFPDHNFYFDVQKNVYIYLSGDKWQVGVKLPSIYSGVNLNVASKVELELETDSPQKYNKDHIVKYKGNSGKVKSSPPSSHPGKGKGKK